MAESTVMGIRLCTTHISFNKDIHTCVCNWCIAFLYPVSNEVACSCTIYRNSRQMDGLQENAKERRIPRFDSAQVFPTGTICSWPLRRSKHERHWWYVAIIQLADFGKLQG